MEVADLPGVPVMTKADLMASFDDIVTDRRLSRGLAELAAHVLGCPTANAQLRPEPSPCPGEGGLAAIRRGVRPMAARRP